MGEEFALPAWGGDAEHMAPKKCRAAGQERLSQPCCCSRILPAGHCSCFVPGGTTQLVLGVLVRRQHTDFCGTRSCALAVCQGNAPRNGNVGAANAAKSVLLSPCCSPTTDTGHGNPVPHCQDQPGSFPSEENIRTRPGEATPPGSRLTLHRCKHKGTFSITFC